MNFRRVGNNLTAFATKDKECGTMVTKGSSMGSISLRTGKFSGMTACFEQLLEEFNARRSAEKSVNHYEEINQERHRRSQMDFEWAYELR